MTKFFADESFLLYSVFFSPVVKLPSFAFRRLKSLLDKTSGTIAVGGQTDEKDLFFAPTIVTNVTSDDELMKDEVS